ncbi:MAG: response regulator [Candidatus Wallbacteria bacterium]|nr:response regulator [Candidatus Wallbacteria bacterium]
MFSVLLVEDEAVLRTTTRDSLALRGYQVKDVGDGAQALRILEGLVFDAIIADVRLPGASGLDVLIAARKNSPCAPVILMTAFGTVPLAVEAMKRGAFDFLTKPFRFEELESVLERGLAEGMRQLPLRREVQASGSLEEKMARHEREEIRRVLEATQGKRTEAARLLGISRKALWEKLKRLG